MRSQVVYPDALRLDAFGIEHLARHDRKEAMKLMRQYREEHGVDVPGQGKLANLLLGGGSGS